jgi:tetratricopeptide (TPR) repeat protein
LAKNEGTQKIEQILSVEKEVSAAWRNAKTRSQEEQKNDTANVYPLFNEARASYYLGEYQTAIQKYELAKDKLPARMLWYQYEPILAYQKVGAHAKVLQLTEAILNNHNRAYSELYYIRAQSFIALDNTEAAIAELEKAITYNKNYSAAKELKSKL